MKRLVCGVVAGALCLAVSSCGVSPVASQGSGEGSMSVRVWVSGGMPKSLQANQTTWDSLVIVVSAPDMVPVRHAVRLSPLEQAVVDTIGGIPEGKDRVVEAWTCTKEGVQIHYGKSAPVAVAPGQNTPVALNLSPVRGSIYINLANVPTTVDSVFAAFYFGNDSLAAKDKRNAIMYLSIDNIPDSTQGVLVIRGTDLAGQTIYSDSMSLLFRTQNNVTMQAQFLAKEGGFVLDLTVQLPGITVVSGQMDKPSMTGAEAGPLVITEIMYYSDGDSDYIEIHNPTATAFVADTLVVEIINTSSTSTIRLVNITIAAGGFYVVGDTDAPPEWVDTVGAMDLTTTGRWILLKAKDGTVMDWVSYTRSEQEWPDCPKFYSIELVPAAVGDPLLNNYGRNWTIATELIAGSNCYGTPGK